MDNVFAGFVSEVASRLGADETTDDVTSIRMEYFGTQADRKGIFYICSE